MSLAPQASESEPPTRVAATNPTQTAPAAAAEGGGSYLVQVSSQDSEADGAGLVPGGCKASTRQCWVPGRR